MYIKSQGVDIQAFCAHQLKLKMGKQKHIESKTGIRSDEYKLAEKMNLPSPAASLLEKQIDKAAIWLCLPAAAAAAAASFSASLFSLVLVLLLLQESAERVLCLMRKQHSQSASVKSRLAFRFC